MHPMTRFFALAMVPIFAALGCGGEATTVDKINDAAPEEIPGGGIGSGAVDGKINVYAIDALTEAPISGAAVRIGDADAAKPLDGMTDATGLITFKDSSLQGAQTITITAADHIASTWYGANGANVTIPLQPTKAPTIETANVAGTIAGWDMLVPPANHAYFAFISSSWSGKLGDPANDIQQPMGMGLPANACIKLPAGLPSPACDWKLVTRTGKIMLFALIADVDTKGTIMDQSDDTRAFYGYAFKLGLDVKAGDNLTGQGLDIMDPKTLIDLKVMTPAAPAGMDQNDAITLLDMGEQGQLPLFAGKELPITKVPPLSGIFAMGRYDVIARAGVMNVPYPSTMNVSHGVDITAAFTPPAYQTPPSDLATNAGVYSFKPATGATIHSAHFEVPMADRVWNLTFYDGRTSFSLPTLTPDPLPVGKLIFRVEAITVPGVDLQNFDAHTAQDKLSALSENGVEITH